MPYICDGCRYMNMRDMGVEMRDMKCLNISVHVSTVYSRDDVIYTRFPLIDLDISSRYRVEVVCRSWRSSRGGARRACGDPIEPLLSSRKGCGNGYEMAIRLYHTYKTSHVRRLYLYTCCTYLYV